MPRDYKRKCPNRTVCTKEQIEAAKNLIKDGKSKRAAADIVGIHESTLRKRLKLDSTATSMGRFKTTFTHDQEMEIYNYCKKTDEMFYGLNLITLRKIVFEFAEVNKIENRFDKTTRMAGKDWVYGFLKRHSDLALRQTTPTSIARAIGFNSVQVQRFYRNLEVCQNKYHFPPARMFNMDETGISTVPKKTPKVISLKGKKNVNKIVSGERGQTVTVICCVSATGNYVPPVGSVGMTSDSGFINTDLYLNWLGHFKYHVAASVANPVLLIVDNHSSHISLQATLYCRKNGIEVLTLPPHSSHKIQPLDRAFFSPLKGQYAVECDRWMAQHPGRAINQYQIASIFDKAFRKVASVGNATAGFQITGIYPYNNALFTEADFAPASVTDMFVEPEQKIDDSGSVSRDLPDSVTADESKLAQNERPQQLVTIAEIHEPPTKVTNSAPIAQESAESLQKHSIDSGASLSPSRSERPETSNDFDTIEVRPKAPQTSPTVANISKPSSHISLTDISPLPKAKHTQTRRKNSSKSEIITASPYKNELEEKQKEKDRKASNARIPKLKGMEIEKKIIDKRKNTNINIKNKPEDSSIKKSKLDIFCPFCTEKYEDPPTEDWIQCHVCNSWWHEKCTDYLNGIFTCDQCTQV